MSLEMKDIIALASSRYFENVQKFGKGLPKFCNNNYFSWNDLAEFYNEPLFKRADDIYGDN